VDIVSCNFCMGFFLWIVHHTGQNYLTLSSRSVVALASCLSLSIVLVQWRTTGGLGLWFSHREGGAKYNLYSHCPCNLGCICSSRLSITSLASSKHQIAAIKN
jgi:hypothetical protein